MGSASFITGLQAMVEWVGYLVLPALAALCVITALVTYSQRKDGSRYLAAALLCLLGPACAQLLNAFVSTTPGTGSHDTYYNGILNLTNWVGNVIMPMFAVLNIIRGIMTAGGFFERFTIGDDWVRYFLIAGGSMMVSGITRLFEHFVTTGASVTLQHSHNIPYVIGETARCLYA